MSLHNEREDEDTASERSSPSSESSSVSVKSDQSMRKLPSGFSVATVTSDPR